MSQDSFYEIQNDFFQSVLRFVDAAICLRRNGNFIEGPGAVRSVSWKLLSGQGRVR